MEYNREVEKEIELEWEDDNAKGVFYPHKPIPNTDDGKYDEETVGYIYGLFLSFAEWSASDYKEYRVNGDWSIDFDNHHDVTTYKFTFDGIRVEIENRYGLVYSNWLNRILGIRGMHMSRFYCHASINDLPIYDKEVLRGIMEKASEHYRAITLEILDKAIAALDKIKEKYGKSVFKNSTAAV